MKCINNVEITGKVFSECKISFKSHGKDFYEFWIEHKTKTGKKYLIKCVTDKWIELFPGTNKRITGRISSHLSDEGIDNYIFVYVVKPNEENVINKFEFEGFTVTKPLFNNKLKSKKKLTTVMLAIDNGTRSYSVPLLIWGLNAEVSKLFELGTHIKVTGKIQSRDFVRDGIDRHVLEFSVDRLEVIENENDVKENHIAWF